MLIWPTFPALRPSFKKYYVGISMLFRRGSCRSCSSVGDTFFIKRNLLRDTPSSSKSIRYTPLFSFFGFTHTAKREKSKDKRSVTASIFPFACVSKLSPHFFCLCLCDVFGASNKSPPSWGCVVSVSQCPFCPPSSPPSIKLVCVSSMFWSTCVVHRHCLSLFSVLGVSVIHTCNFKVSWWSCFCT